MFESGIRNHESWFDKGGIFVVKGFMRKEGENREGGLEVGRPVGEVVCVIIVLAIAAAGVGVGVGKMTEGLNRLQNSQQKSEAWDELSGRMAKQTPETVLFEINPNK